MKKLTILFLFISNYSFAQPDTSLTTFKFYSFIPTQEIEWASHNYFITRFKNPVFNDILFNRYAKQEIKGCSPVWIEPGREMNIYYCGKGYVDSFYMYDHGDPIIDSNGNISEFPKQEPKIIHPADLDSTEIDDILYIKNGELKSTVTWVTPLMPVTTSAGVYLGESVYFSTCFNLNIDYKPAKKNTILFLAQTSRNIRLDSFDLNMRALKELYGRNIIKSLWPYIMKNKFDVFSVDKNKKISASELNRGLLNSISIKETPYDSIIGIPPYEYPNSLPLTADDFLMAALKQDWYYDRTANIVFNKIREMWLYTKKIDGYKEDDKPSPILKIVF